MDTFDVLNFKIKKFLRKNPEVSKKSYDFPQEEFGGK